MAEDKKPEIIEEKKAEENDSGNGKTENAEKTPEEPPKEMRAIVLTGFGGLKTVKVLKKPEPTVAPGEVLIRVKACGLNFHDLMARLGVIDSPPKPPFILGFECAGEIEQVGEEVKDFSVGDRVVALPDYKAWAELVSVPTKYVFKIPAAMSYEDAAAICINYLVAYILLFELGQLTPGKSVLLHSAGGGVGLAIVNLSKTVENVKLFGIASKGKHEALQNAGIDHLIERGSDYVSEIRKISPEGVDIVLDCLCGEECNRGNSLLKPLGRYVLYGSAYVVTGETRSLFSAAKAWWQVDKVSPVKLFVENKTISGFNLRHLLYHQGQTEFVRDTLNKIFDLWTASKITPVIDSKLALEDVAEGMQKMHDRKNVGKLILDPSLEPKPKPATPLKSKGKNADKEDKKKNGESAETPANEVSSPVDGEKEKEAEKTDEKKEEKKEEAA